MGRNPSGRFVLTGALRLKCDQACRRNHAALGGAILIEYGFMSSARNRHHCCNHAAVEELCFEDALQWEAAYRDALPPELASASGCRILESHGDQVRKHRCTSCMCAQYKMTNASCIMNATMHCIRRAERSVTCHTVPC